MTLPIRRIHAYEVSAIGLGCMNLSHGYGDLPSEEEGARLLNHALDAGCTLLDTAAIYGEGANERLIGRAVMHRRREFTLASKCVLDAMDGKRMLDARPDTIVASCDRSLARLGTDMIDLFYMHRLDPDVPIEESMGAMAGLVRAGKIGAIGLSEMSAATVERAHAVHPVAAVQSEYSLAVRNPEIAVLDTCRRLGIAFVAFSPVARGLLAGGVTDDDFSASDLRRSMPRFLGERLTLNLSLVDRLRALAAEAGCTPAQFALAWLMARDPCVVPIPGTRSMAHLDEDLGAATLRLDLDHLSAADALFPPNAMAGPRYPAALQRQIDTELLPDEELA